MYAVLRAIYREWQKREELARLLPAERLWVGQAGCPPPFAVIYGNAQKVYRRTTHGYLCKGSVSIVLAAEELSRVEELAEAVRRQFDGWRGSLGPREILLGLCLSQTQLRPMEEGGWEKQLDFSAVILYPMVDPPLQEG